MSKNKIAVFQEQEIRRHWDDREEKWYFSVVDVIALLTDSDNPQVYWRVLKKRLIDEGSSETVTKCNGLKMRAIDGKMRLTDIADTETMLRLIQSIPSPKAEPFKLWLAQVGYERLEETVDPEIAIDRAMLTYLKKGYSKNWINSATQFILALCERNSIPAFLFRRERRHTSFPPLFGREGGGELRSHGEG
ncbi:MAG: Bro-N domain-containing protein [Candidatus Magasanikbacteria bacterium]|nr:Bro-N domain-containing protein [Candidatus Magasanikbacteria bacterium]